MFSHFRTFAAIIFLAISYDMNLSANGQKVFRFSVTKPSKSSNVRLLLDTSKNYKLAECKIRYSNDWVHVPKLLMTFAYSTADGFTIPVVWSRVKETCEIEITFVSAENFPVALIFAPGPLITDFWVSDMVNLDSDAILTVEGSSEVVLVEVLGSCPFVYDCSSNKVLETSVTQFGKIVLELSLVKSKSWSVFLKATRNSIRVYSKNATPLTITTKTKRKVVLVYEPNFLDRHAQHVKLGETLPAWNGTTVVCHWTEHPGDFLKMALSLTHVRIPKYLTPKQQAQLACLLGLSVERTQEALHSLIVEEISVNN
jgi:hypothetical protein